MGGRCCAYDAVALARGDASVDSVKGAVGDAGRGDLGGGGTLCGRFRGVVTEQGADVHGRELGWRENGHVGGASQRQAAAVRPGLRRPDGSGSLAASVRGRRQSLTMHSLSVPKAGVNLIR